MEQGSTSLCTNACNDNGNSTFKKNPHDFLGVSAVAGPKVPERSFPLLDEPRLFLLLKKLELRFACPPRLPPRPVGRLELFWPPPRPFERLIFEAIKQCEVQDVKVVVLSEEFFASIWPIMVSTVLLLSFLYLYYIDYIDRGGSKTGSSGSLDFRDIYISIVLFHAAYVWIKFRDVIPKGAVFRRLGSNKWEPRIKFPVMKGVGGKSKRIPLGSYDTKADGEVVYRIAAFYCNKPMHCLGRLHLGGGAYFPIPTLSVDPNSTYEKQVKQVRDQVLKVYAEFEEHKASRNMSPHLLGQSLETSTVEGERLTTPPIQQPEEPLNSGMDLTLQGQGSQHAPNINNGVDFHNPSSLRHELLEAYKEIDSLKAQLSRKEDELNELKQRHSELEGLLEQSRLPELDFDPDNFFDMIEA